MGEQAKKFGVMVIDRLAETTPVEIAFALGRLDTDADRNACIELLRDTGFIDQGRGWLNKLGDAFALAIRPKTPPKATEPEPTPTPVEVPVEQPAAPTFVPEPDPTPPGTPTPAACIVLPPHHTLADVVGAGSA